MLAQKNIRQNRQQGHVIGSASGSHRSFLPSFPAIATFFNQLNLYFTSPLSHSISHSISQNILSSHTTSSITVSSFKSFSVYTTTMAPKRDSVFVVYHKNENGDVTLALASSKRESAEGAAQQMKDDGKRPMLKLRRSR